MNKKIILMIGIVFLLTPTIMGGFNFIHVSYAYAQVLLITNEVEDLTPFNFYLFAQIEGEDPDILLLEKNETKQEKAIS